MRTLVHVSAASECGQQPAPLVVVELTTTPGDPDELFVGVPPIDDVNPGCCLC